jgi:seryl-tRNA synthetase
MHAVSVSVPNNKIIKDSIKQPLTMSIQDDWFSFMWPSMLTSSDDSDLEDQALKVAKERNSLQAQLMEAQQEIDQLNSLQAQLMDAQQEIDQLKKEKSSLRDVLDGTHQVSDTDLERGSDLLDYIFECAESLVSPKQENRQAPKPFRSISTVNRKFPMPRRKSKERQPQQRQPQEVQPKQQENRDVLDSVFGWTVTRQ